jgi:hypothetical protein
MKHLRTCLPSVALGMRNLHAELGEPPATAPPKDWLAELAAKYRDLPPPKLSAKALGKPTESLRPLRPGSKWGLPA